MVHNWSALKCFHGYHYNSFLFATYVTYVLVPPEDMIFTDRQALYILHI
jgi:hypothetical protein